MPVIYKDKSYLDFIGRRCLPSNDSVVLVSHFTKRSYPTRTLEGRGSPLLKSVQLCEHTGVEHAVWHSRGQALAGLQILGQDALVLSVARVYERIALSSL